jgi:hypothetical protein
VISTQALAGSTVAVPAGASAGVGDAVRSVDFGISAVVTTARGAQVIAAAADSNGLTQARPASLAWRGTRAPRPHPR